MKFYTEKEQIHLETDASRSGLKSSLLLVRDEMQFPKDESPSIIALWLIVFASSGLTSAETLYSNIENEALIILHGLEKIHHYCFACDISVITDYKLLVTILKRRCSGPIAHTIQCHMMHLPI